MKLTDSIDDIKEFIKDKRVWWEHHNNSFLGEDGFWELHFPNEWKNCLSNLDSVELLDLATFGLDSKVFNVILLQSLRKGGLAGITFRFHHKMF